MSGPVSPEELIVIKQRIRRFYKAYAPQNVDRVDYIVNLYLGKERQIMDDIMKKYAKPEPKTPLEPLPSAPATPPAETAPPAADSREDPSVPTGGSADAPATGSTSASPTATTTAPTSAASVAANSAAPTSTTAAVQAAQENVNNNNNKASASSPRGGVQKNSAVNAVDALLASSSIVTSMSGPESYDLLRESVKDNVGFRSQALQRAWEDAWMGKIPLGNYRKTWQGARSVIHEGYGWKLTVRAKPVQRWQRRYFVLVPNFLYYFDTDDSMAPVKGAVFMDKATITQSTQKDKKALVIASHFHKKPLELDANGDYSTFTISFDAPKVQNVWFSLLTKISMIVASPEPSSSASGPSAAATGGGGPLSLPQQQQQQQMLSYQTATAPLTPTLTAVSSPREDYASHVVVPNISGTGEEAFLAASLHRQPSQSALRRSSVYEDSSSDAMLSPGSSRQFFPSESGRWGPYNADGEAQLLEAENIRNNNQDIATGHNNNSSGNYYSSSNRNVTFERSATPQHPHQSPIPHHNNNNPHQVSWNSPQLQPQQQLSQLVRQELREVMQQSQEDYAYRQKVQADAARHVLQVDEDEMKKRIQRVSMNKDTTQLAAALMTFVIDHVSDVNALWKLMGLLDDLPVASAAATPVVSTPQAVAGGVGGSAAPPPVLQYEPQIVPATRTPPIASTSSSFTMMPQPPLAYTTAPPTPTPLVARSVGYPLQQNTGVPLQPSSSPSQLRDPHHHHVDDPLEAYALAMQRQRPPVALGTPIVAAAEWHPTSTTTPPPSSRSDGRLLSPEPGVVPAPAARGPPTGQPTSAAGPYHSSSHYQQNSVPLAGDVQWEQRMGKIQARKRMIESILGGIQ